MTSRRISALWILGAVLLALGGPVAALESEGFVLSEANPKQSRDYPPLILFNPSGAVTSPTLDDCRSLPTHNTVRIGLQLKDDVPVKVVIKVGWGVPPEANDVDVYMFDSSGESVGTGTTSTNNPEVINLSGIPNGDYYVCAVSSTGQNTGFTVSGEIVFLDLYKFTPTTPIPTSSSPVDSAGPRATEPASTAAGASPETVESPGADGPFAAKDLVAVSGSRQARAKAEGTSVTRTALLTLSGAIALGGIGIVVLRIRRDLTS